ncbi:MAG: hypothetical protein M3Z26_15630 [Bacteroidota bacterium]|nr:hypothetical protein [Bacteroidota bacterium]
MISRIGVVIVILFAFYSCSKDKIDGSVQTNADLANALRLSPVAIQIDSDSLFLTTSLWRNFMPETEKNGSGLYCSNKLAHKDSIPIPPELKLKNLYVINGNQIWTSQDPQISKEEPSSIRIFINSGPKWGPDVFVDVVCEFEINKKTYRIIAKQQEIDAVY